MKSVWDPGQHKEKKIKRSRVPRIPVESPSGSLTFSLFQLL